jgi:hypothetical protein
MYCENYIEERLREIRVLLNEVETISLNLREVVIDKRAPLRHEYRCLSEQEAWFDDNTPSDTTDKVYNRMTEIDNRMMYYDKILDYLDSIEGE